MGTTSSTFSQIAWGVITTLAVGLAVSSPPPNDGERDTSPFGGITAVIARGRQYEVGTFDKNGNFRPDPTRNPLSRHDNVYAAGHYTANFPRTAHVRCYEFRSDLLIPGVMCKNVSDPTDPPLDQFREPEDTAFAPDIGASVLDAKSDFDQSKPDRWVWNWPEAARTFYHQKKHDAKQITDAFAVSLPESGGMPSGYDMKPYPPGLRHIHVLENVARVGRLTSRGEFIPDYTLPPLARPARDRNLGLRPDRAFYTLPAGEKMEEQVFEFRSGRLIEGTLQDTGNFIPKKGSKVIAFKDYNPKAANALRIYNLPGTLTEKKK